MMAVLATSDAHAERRVALVIGNAHYEYAHALRNPLNDAHDIGELLKKLGFEVLVGTDLDQRQFAGEIDKFGRMLEGADVALFFYAGHGLQMNDKNFLVSTGAKLENEFLVPAETVELDTIVHLMESRSRVNLVFLDACRNNPLADQLRQNLVASNRSVSLGRGLARVEPTGRDTLIAFSAAPGQEAADGHDRNSPFTAALLENIPKPGVEVSVMLKQVAAEVRRETHNAQRPQQLSDMTRTFYFANAEPATSGPQLTQRAAPSAPDHSVEVAYWNAALSVNNCDSVRAYLARYPQGLFADLAKISERNLCDNTRKVTVVDTEVPAKGSKQSALQREVPSASSATEAPRASTATEPPDSSAKESKVASLPPASEAAPEPTPAPDNSAAQAELTRDLQRELVRVGCSAGRADGVWGARSQDALREFSRHARASLDADVPSKEALAAVQRRHSRVCPGEVEKPARARREPLRPRERAKAIERGQATTIGDWKSISPLCESGYTQGGRTCCTYDPPRGPPVIICR
jgi:hypothetical protein